MKLNGYDIQGTPQRAEYKRNDNGLYTIEIKNYIVTTPDGQQCEAILRFPNAKLPFDKPKGVIDFNETDIQYFAAKDEENKSIWEFVIPNTKD